MNTAPVTVTSRNACRDQRVGALRVALVSTPAGFVVATHDHRTDAHAASEPSGWSVAAARFDALVAAGGAGVGVSADVAFGVKLSYDGRGGRHIGNGSAGYAIARFATEAEAVAFALRHRRSLMPNLPACVRAALAEVSL